MRQLRAEMTSVRRRIFEQEMSHLTCMTCHAHRYQHLLWRPEQAKSDLTMDLTPPFLVRTLE